MQYLIAYAARETADGVFSADFSETVKTWQKEHTLSADGIIGEKTWRALVSGTKQETTMTFVLQDGSEHIVTGVR